MNEHPPALRLDERVQAENRLYTSLFHVGDRRIWWSAMALATLLHVAAIAVPLPERARRESEELPREVRQAIVVRRYLPPPPPNLPPPRAEAPAAVGQTPARRIPVPDPTPDEPEPIPEPVPQTPVRVAPLPPDTGAVLGTPQAPPVPGSVSGSGPLIAGAPGVTVPELIPESKISPIYPEKARLARLAGRVILQAVIARDGTVDDVTVLRCDKAGVGFEEAAIRAVKHWHYRPAEQYGEPVDVYFTVTVDFVLE